MKAWIALLLCGAAALPALAADDAAAPVNVMRVPLGSGTPSPGASVGSERAYHVAADAYHVPGQLPGHPTAATIWPRQLWVSCSEDRKSGELLCDGYAVHPATGRGEYLYVTPVVQPAPPPTESVTDIVIIPMRCPCDERPPRVTLKKPRG